LSIPTLITFQEAIQQTPDCKRHLLLGNGFSINLFPKRFHYGSLFDEADFSNLPEARKAFELLGTIDFEVVIQALLNASAILPVYSQDSNASSHMREQAESLKELLIQAIAGRHPERPGEVRENQFQACRKFLSYFRGDSRNFKPIEGKDCRGQIYTLNYDLLLYWALLHIDQDENTVSEAIEHDDGFRAPDYDPDAPFVTWDAEGAADGQNIHYLHGALHLFDNGPEIEKRCWKRSGEKPLIDQIREALAQNKFPLFVSEGNSQAKLTRIRHSGYLLRSLKSFAKVLQVKESSLFVFGHSLAVNDEHILKHIEKGHFKRLYISLYGNPEHPANRAIISRATRFSDNRPEKSPLKVSFFDAESASVWN
jgi:hypothetical protein